MRTLFLNEISGIISSIILSITLLVPLSSNSQNQSNFISLSSVQGNQVLSFLGSLEDDAGYIWLTHSTGFYKYDGYQYSLIPFQEIIGEHFINGRNILTHKDSTGNFWISTFNELAQIDTRGFYNSTYRDSLSRYNAKFQILSFASKDESVWMGSDNGILYRYDYEKEVFDSIISLPLEVNAHQGIKSLCIINKEIIIGTTIGNIYKYSLTDSSLSLILGLPGGFTNNIRVVNDHNNNVWIFTEAHGIFIYDQAKDKIEKFNYSGIDTDYFEKSIYYNIFCDSSGIIWAGTDGNGLFRIDPTSGNVLTYINNPLNEFSLKNNTILHINEDSHNNIWIVTKGGHVQILPKRNIEIKYQSGSQDNSPSRILCVLKDKEGVLWSGTDGDGLSRIQTEGNSVQYGLNPVNENGFNGKFIQSLAEDNIGNIWIGTYQNGLWMYNKNSNQFKKIDITNTSGFPALDVRFLFRDSKNRMWVNTDIGIYVFSDNNKILANFIAHDNGLYGGVSQSICEDSEGNLWVGINQGGLFVFEEDSKDFSNSFFKKHLYYTNQKGDGHNYNIASMAPDQNGVIWLITVSGTLVRYNTYNNSYISFRDKEEFKNIEFSAVLVENSKNLWLSSQNGIIHYKISEDEIDHYYQIDGLQGNNFTKRSCFKDVNGIMYFGGVNGMNYFLPKALDKKEILANLYINNIEILNQPAQLVIPDQMNKGVINVEQLKLRSEQSSFTFRFSAMNNLLNSNFHYAYRLSGFNDHWIEPERELLATYTNIPHGNYNFEVKAGTKKGIWDIPAKSIAIHIMPPWYLSTWAYLIYLAILVFISYSFFNWLKLRRKLAQEEWEHHKDKEMYALKMNFFTKMSHEIQTPLTLIMGPVDDMLRRLKGEDDATLQKRLSIILNNTKRLSQIATELTSARNLEVGKLRIKVSKANIIHHLKQISVSFDELAKFRRIQFNQKYLLDNYEVWYDHDMIEHVVYNLLSNAFKFTPSGGKVEMITKLDVINEQFQIAISDSGPGIPKDELEKIFHMFYQSDLGKKSKGTGIGLALSKELITLHHGNITVNTTPGKGTSFTATISTQPDIYANENKKEIEVGFSEIELKDSFLKNELLSDEIKTTLTNNLNITNGKTKNKSLLIVEDNPQMQIFLDSVFNNQYKLLFADNGKEGIQMAEKKHPDLIISDVMMPHMNGIEMSKILQKKKSTQHIPIILMSARNQDGIKIKGLESGAIEYIHKPFNIQELILKVKNFITRSESVIAKYRSDLISTPDHPNEISTDDVFLEKLVTVITNQIDNPHFRLEDLAEHLNMSYSAIYRKCQSITGKTLVEFVRCLKIKKAALLIIKYGNGVSESAYKSGFNDPKYFAKCFKKEYGKSPLLMKKESVKTGVEETIKKYNLEKVV